MTKIKKVALVLAVVFVAAVGAGWAIFNTVADMVTQTMEANNERD